MSRIFPWLKKLGWKRLLFAVLNLLLVFAGAVCLIALNSLSHALPTLTAAGRFRGASDTRFAQIACFMPVDKGKSVDDIRSFRTTLQSKLEEQSLTPPEGGSLILDAYSGSATLKASGDGGSADVEAVGVGGDFFYFHPYTLRSGNYFSEDDLMDDLVVLDEETAWKLFGGSDLTGMTLTIEGQPFFVAGVIAREDDPYSQQAYAGEGGLFMSFSALSRIKEDASISCYELLMPDPISGYALGVAKESFDTGGGDVVENSARYSLPHLIEVVRAFGQRSMRVNGVIYPYWENAVRLTEDYAALFLLLAALALLTPALSLLVIAIRSIRSAYRFAKKKIPEKVNEAVEHHREKLYSDDK